MKRLIERLTQARIYRHPPRGLDVVYDITHHLPRLTVDVVFDVGAHTGQSATQFLEWFPRSRVYCFEPVRSTFLELAQKVGRNARAHCHQVALGASRGAGVMLCQGTPDLFHLEAPRRTPNPVNEIRREDVSVETLDSFCRDAGIQRISYLKIDTEGGDLEVLQGADGMLFAQRIDLVQTEAGMNCTNDRHVPFVDFTVFLESRKYFLFAIYEQVPEWTRNEPHLRRANLLFISERVLKDNSPQRTPAV